MHKKSAGILLYRISQAGPEVLLIHPGGPFWRKKDAGAWSIPKGEFDEGEDPLHAAIRELHEETGIRVTGKDHIPLAPVTQKAGKHIYAFAIQGDADPGKIKSNSFEMGWPPRSGRKQVFPEVDKAGWFTIAQAKEKINPAQAVLLDELVRKLSRK